MNTENYYWERMRGFFTEHNIDARWLLKNKNDEKTYGSLRVVSHPDLKPGYLRVFYTIVDEVHERTRKEIQKLIDDCKMKESELEVYSAKDKLVTTTDKFEAPKREIEEMFKVKIFE